MAQIFHRSANTLSRVTIFGAIFIAGFVLWVIGGIVRSPYFTNQGIHREQVVPFSHQHHVAGLGIDCRYCHTSVDKSSSAGMPSTHTCMTCHSQLWTDSPELEVVRESYRTGKPIVWERVHDLPDFAYFDHSIHVTKGIGCVSCHGRVDRMPQVWKEKTLSMAWCLDCHRNPEKYIRPQDYVTDMEFVAKPGVTPDPQQLKKDYHILSSQQMTNCSTCHR